MQLGPNSNLDFCTTTNLYQKVKQMNLTPKGMLQKQPVIKVEPGDRILAPGGDIFTAIAVDVEGFLAIDSTDEEFQFEFESLQIGWEVLGK